MLISVTQLEIELRERISSPPPPASPEKRLEPSLSTSRRVPKRQRTEQPAPGRGVLNFFVLSFPSSFPTVLIRARNRKFSFFFATLTTFSYLFPSMRKFEYSPFRAFHPAAFFFFQNELLIPIPPTAPRAPFGTCFSGTAKRKAGLH